MAKTNGKNGSLSDLMASMAAAGLDPQGPTEPTITGRVLPPIERWNPPYCGDIDIEIRADGSWWHEGALIKRDTLVRLFASILMRDSDGSYYLITPVEKVKIHVHLHPLIVIDTESSASLASTYPTQQLVLNTGGRLPLSSATPLALEPRANGAAYVHLDRGLTALFSRPAWYRLVASADDAGIVHSGSYAFSLADHA